ncbi:MAG TPA: nucleoside 2-deoxyribosyltransferase [Gemmataceae bacterium]
MRRADIVVAVVDPTPASNFVFYEVGFAQGMNKPVVVLLAEGASPSIWVSSGIPYFRFDPDNPEGLEFGVNQILAIPHRGVKAPSLPVKRTHRPRRPG